MIDRLNIEDWLESKSSSIKGLTVSEVLDIEFAESGKDRELCFNLEAEIDKRYERYLNS